MLLHCPHLSDAVQKISQGRNLKIISMKFERKMNFVKISFECLMKELDLDIYKQGKKMKNYY